MFSQFKGGPAFIVTAAFIGPGTITLCVSGRGPARFFFALGHGSFHFDHQ